MKKYNFDIRYLDSRYNRYGTMAVSATSIMDAKNQCKAIHPYAKNISCVRRGETVSFGANGKVSSSRTSSSKNESSESSSVGSMLLGAAITAGIGLAASWFSKDKE